MKSNSIRTTGTVNVDTGKVNKVKISNPKTVEQLEEQIMDIFMEASAMAITPKEYVEAIRQLIKDEAQATLAEAMREARIDELIGKEFKDIWEDDDAQNDPQVAFIKDRLEWRIKELTTNKLEEEK